MTVLDFFVIGLLLFLYPFAITFGILFAKHLVSKMKNR